MEDSLIKVLTMCRSVGIDTLNDCNPDGDNDPDVPAPAGKAHLGAQIHSRAEDIVYETVMGHLKEPGVSMTQSSIIVALSSCYSAPPRTKTASRILR